MKSSIFWSRIHKTKEVIIIENQRVILYSTPTCPKCKILKSKLVATEVEYTEISDVNFMMNKGIMSVPILEVDGNMKSFDEAIQWVVSTKTQKEGI